MVLAFFPANRNLVTEFKASIIRYEPSVYPPYDELRTVFPACLRLFRGEPSPLASAGARFINSSRASWSRTTHTGFGDPGLPTLTQAPSDWLGRRASNPQPPESKSGALPIALRPKTFSLITFSDIPMRDQNHLLSAHTSGKLKMRTGKELHGTE